MSNTLIPSQSYNGQLSKNMYVANNNGRFFATLTGFTRETGINIGEKRSWLGAQCYKNSYHVFLGFPCLPSSCHTCQFKNRKKSILLYPCQKHERGTLPTLLWSGYCVGCWSNFQYGTFLFV